MKLFIFYYNMENLDWLVMDAMVYSVKLIYQITITGTPQKELLDVFYNEITDFFEEQLLLVRAPDFDNAYKKASDYAKKQEENYINKYGQTVQYKFFEHYDCFHLFDDIFIGTEFDLVEGYSCYFYRDIDVSKGFSEESFLEKRYAQASVEEIHKLRHR